MVRLRYDDFDISCFVDSKVVETIFFTGLHYDALAVADHEGAPESLDTTRIPVGSSLLQEAMLGASSLVSKYHDLRQYTDTARFTLRCNVCNTGLVGEEEALKHAQTTGHQNFSEY